jgi:hypothetical protein
MSTPYLRLIPIAPAFVPDEQAQAEVRAVLAAALPQAGSVTARATDGIQFVDQGGNLDQVACPAYVAALSLEWWGGAMDAAWGDEGFRTIWARN